MRLLISICLAAAMAAATMAATAVPARATAACGGDFGAWLQGVKQEAAADGISQAAMVPPRLARARQKMLVYASLLSRIEQQYGVPGGVIVAIWGLETDFGADTGHFPTIRSLATLAYDCRRPDKFRGELIAALRMIDRGDMTPAAMRGAWAGEIGQTQFLPSSYLKYAVDFDGSGRRDLIHDVPDVLASTANYLKGYGWQRGQPWGEGTANFQVLLQWNASQVYTKTVAYFGQLLESGQ